MKYLTIFLLLYCLTARGQANINPYSINLTFTPQLFLNSCNVKNDGIAPETISTKNTGGYRFGMGIERKSRKNGFIIGLGLAYGRQHQYLMIHYDNLSFYDPSIAEELNKSGSLTYEYGATPSYMDLYFAVGYIFPFKILKEWNIVTKGRISLRSYSYSYGKNRNIGIEFIKNDTLNLGLAGAHSVGFGGGGANQLEMEFYTGIIKKVNSKFLKNISISFGVNRVTPIGSGGSNAGNAIVYSYYIYTANKPLSLDKYSTKDFAIGLKLSAGFWYN